MMMRRRGIIPDSAISTTPANTVMARTAGNPPALAASTEGPRYIAEKTGGAMNRDPIGPRGNAWRTVAMASPIMPRLTALRDTCSEAPAARTTMTMRIR
jgi:hypothetical protein